MSESENTVKNLFKGNTYSRRIKNLYELVKKISNQSFKHMHQSGDKYNMQFEKILRPLPESFLHTPKSLKGLKHFHKKGISLFIQFLLICVICQYLIVMREKQDFTVKHLEFSQNYDQNTIKFSKVTVIGQTSYLIYPQLGDKQF